MIRVLHSLGDLGFGGAEAVIMNWYRNINRSKVQFDFMVRSCQKNYEDEIISMGGRVYHTASFPRHWLRNYVETAKIIKKREWDVIHVHANALLYVKPLQIAKQYDIPVRIIHSHNSQSKYPLLHNLNKRRIDRWVTDKFACSDLAAEWMFGNQNYHEIKNGIDISKYSYNEVNRKEIRDKYGIGNRKVIGHVGRFIPQKNHVFLIHVFEEYYKNHKESVLMLVGDGEDMIKIRNLVERKGLNKCVIFIGATPETYKYYSAMDFFLFPSLYEGLGVVLLEAQANGLPCLISESIPTMVRVNSNVSVCKLNEGIDGWAKMMDTLSRIDPEDISDEIKEFDIIKTSKMLEEYYCNQC